MKNLKQLTQFFLASFLLLFAFNVFAQEETTESNLSQAQLLNQEQNLNLPETNCFDYYKFQSVQVSLGTIKENFAPGEYVQLKGEIINENDQPIVNGNVFARVSKKNENYVQEGNYIVDEFFLEENLALNPNETKTKDYGFILSKNLSQGEYQIDFFFSAGKKFNLGGLPFSNEVVIGSTDFNVQSNQTSFISFDRSNTTVNGEAYQHIGNWPTIEAGQSVTIKQPLLNTYNETKEAQISYNLYHWDSLDQTDFKDNKIEIINLQPGSNELTYTIESMNDAVYYLQIIAQVEEERSIVNIRIASPQQNIRLNYPAITKFPINQGENFTLYSCFHNGANANANGKVAVALEDKTGKTVGQFQYEGLITSGMLADKVDLTAKQDYDYLKLTAKTYDANNNLTDEYEVVYDCNDFGKCLDEKNQTINQNPSTSRLSKAVLLIAILSILIVSTVILVVFLVTKKIKK